MQGRTVGSLQRKGSLQLSRWDMPTGGQVSRGDSGLTYRLEGQVAAAVVGPEKRIRLREAQLRGRQAVVAKKVRRFSVRQFWKASCCYTDVHRFSPHIPVSSCPAYNVANQNLAR
jgi:hypothetical protein